VSPVPSPRRTMAGVLWRHRFLLVQLTRRAFLGRTAGTVLGWGWSLLATAVQLGTLWVVFAVILGIKVAEPAGVNFGVYLMTGLVPFLALNEALIGAVSLFRENAVLVQRIRFPLEVLVVSGALGTLLHQGLAFLVVIAVCAVTGTLAPAAAGWTAGGIGLLLLWALGLAGLAAVGGAFLPDVGQALGVVLQLLFYASPIVYPLSMVRAPLLRTVIEANPVTVMIQMIRAGLIGAAPPGLAAVTAVAAGGLAAMAAGAWAVDRWRARIPDVV